MGTKDVSHQVPYQATLLTFVDSNVDTQSVPDVAISRSFALFAAWKLPVAQPCPSF
jgi:hypothetical protein